MHRDNLRPKGTFQMRRRGIFFAVRDAIWAISRSILYLQNCFFAMKTIKSDTVAGLQIRP